MGLCESRTAIFRTRKHKLVKKTSSLEGARGSSPSIEFFCLLVEITIELPFLVYLRYRFPPNPAWN